MGRRRCCCGDCPGVIDDFNRADNLSLGGDWTEVDGDWEIKDQQLREIGTGSPALAIHTTPGPRDDSFRGSVYIPSVVAGAKYMVVVNYLNSSNYHYAQSYYPATGDWTLSLHKVTGGVPSTLASIDFNNSASFVGIENSLSACFSDWGFETATFYDPYTLWMAYPVPHVGGTKHGLGNASSATIDYDDYAMTEHRDTHPDCLSCFCRCNGQEVVPMVLNARLWYTGSLEPCPELNVTLTAMDEDNDPGFGTSTYRWYGTGSMSCPGCYIPTSANYEVVFECSCAAGGGKQYSIWVDNDVYFPGENEECETRINSCDPFSVLFDITGYVLGGYCSGQTGDSADLHIEVTEP